MAGAPFQEILNAHLRNLEITRFDRHMVRKFFTRYFPASYVDSNGMLVSSNPGGLATHETELAQQFRPPSPEKYVYKIYNAAQMAELMNNAKLAEFHYGHWRS